VRRLSADLTTPVHLGLKPDARPASDVDCPHTLGTIYLVTTDGHKVNMVVIDIDRDLAHSLSCVCVEEDLALSAHLAYLLCGLDDACMLTGVKCMIERFPC